MAEVQLEDVSKVYGDGTRAVDSMSLEVSDGEFMVLVGPSGCGKTTALRMVAGLEEISEGTLRIGDRIVNDLTPRERDIAMVFQSYALYPHLSVYDNIAFSLKLHKLPKPEIDKRVHDAARILDLEPYLKRKPKALSGGQRQRVAMGRAIVRNPSAFLMDEPLSNLDAKLRVQMRAEISELQRNLGVTTIYVTHDQVEAMTMGDRVAVMRKGELQQAAEPQELYDHPVNLFVAGFIGSPAMNLLEATLQSHNGGLTVRSGSQEILLSQETLAQRPALRSYEGRTVVLGIRPEDLEDHRLAGESAHGGRLQGTVTLRESLGAEIIVHFSADAPPAVTEDVKELAEDVGEADRVAAHAEASSTVIVGRFGARSRVKPGDEIEVAVDTRQLHFFDVDSGLGIYGDGAVPGAAV
ncbi:MAG: ABC transporter ATP-binding protein [Gaiellaceae bacterium]